MQAVTECAGIRTGSTCEPVLTPMMRAIRRYGGAVPIDVLHALNTVSSAEWQRIRHEARLAEVRRYAETQRRERENRRALQWR